ncbi:MAG TPA: TetR/AcrR family transcriptional regulator [Acidimicrobiales bacterium]|nr:TetR/AcrR family transcriptional regulator [Acidimicrobiales bacterium]
MAGRSEEGAATRRRIIAAAERLFGRNGIDGVSIRDIAASAKVNSAATFYHFGTKDDLVVAILKLRAAELRERTQPIVSALEEGSPSVRQIVEALVRPMVDMGKNYAAFSVAVTSHPKYQRFGAQEFEKESLVLLEHFKRTAPQLPAEVAASRFATAQVLMVQALGNLRQRIEYWRRHLHSDGEVDYVEALIDFIAGGLVAPTSDWEKID